MPAPDAGRPWRLVEPGGRYSVLELPGRAKALVQAAAGIVAAAPDGDGRARALEVLGLGGEQALVLAVTVLREAIGDRMV